MRRLMSLVLAALLVAGSPPRALAEPPVSRQAAIADFRMTFEAHTQSFTDQVMGNVFTGGVVLAQVDGT